MTFSGPAGAEFAETARGRQGMLHGPRCGRIVRKGQEGARLLASARLCAKSQKHCQGDGPFPDTLLFAGAVRRKLRDRVFPRG